VAPCVDINCRCTRVSGGRKERKLFWYSFAFTRATAFSRTLPSLVEESVPSLAATTFCGRRAINSTVSCGSLTCMEKTWRRKEGGGQRRRLEPLSLAGCGCGRREKGIQLQCLCTLSLSFSVGRLVCSQLTCVYCILLKKGGRASQPFIGREEEPSCLHVSHEGGHDLSTSMRRPCSAVKDAAYMWKKRPPL